MPALQKVVAFFLHCLLTILSFLFSAFSVLEVLALNYVCASDPRCFVYAWTFASADKWGKRNDPIHLFDLPKKTKHSLFNDLSVCVLC